jgi:hypothetical protein
VSLVSKSALNGKRGIVQHFVAGSGRYGVKIDGEQAIIALKPANLQAAPAIGRKVIVVCLVDRSELNGSRGVVHGFNSETMRFEVKVDGKVLSLKPQNLREVVEEKDVLQTTTAAQADAVKAWAKSAASDQQQCPGAGASGLSRQSRPPSSNVHERGVGQANKVKQETLGNFGALVTCGEGSVRPPFETSWWGRSFSIAYRNLFADRRPPGVGMHGNHWGKRANFQLPSFRAFVFGGGKPADVLTIPTAAPFQTPAVDPRLASTKVQKLTQLLVEKHRN